MRNWISHLVAMILTIIFSCSITGWTQVKGDDPASRDSVKFTPKMVHITQQYANDSTLVTSPPDSSAVNVFWSMRANQPRLLFLSGCNTFTRTRQNIYKAACVISFVGCDHREVLSTFSTDFYSQWLKLDDIHKAFKQAKRTLLKRHPDTPLKPRLICE